MRNGNVYFKKCLLRVRVPIFSQTQTHTTHTTHLIFFHIFDIDELLMLFNELWIFLDGSRLSSMLFI